MAMKKKKKKKNQKSVAHTKKEKLEKPLFEGNSTQRPDLFLISNKSCQTWIINRLVYLYLITSN